MKYCDAAKDKAYKKKCCDAAPGPSEPDTGTGTEGTGTEGTEGTGTEGTGTSSESEPECVDTVPTKKCAENPNTKKWCTAKSKKKSFRLDKCARTCMKYCDAAKDKAYKKKCCDAAPGPSEPDTGTGTEGTGTEGTEGTGTE